MRLPLLCFLLISLSCSEEKKAIETVLEEIDRRAVLRTVEIRNGEFDINDLNSEFNILLEEQDIDDGGLLERVVIRLTFVDNSPQNGNQSIGAFIFEELQSLDFTISTVQLQNTNTVFSFEQLLAASNLVLGDLSCKGQFKLDLDLILSDGRIFNTANSAGAVVNNLRFLKSPFLYLINIVNPIPSEKFTGVYQMETIEDIVNGIPFGIEFGQVKLKQGHSNNVKVFKHLATNTESIDVEISIVCDIAVVTRYQKTLLPTFALQLDQSDRVLLGPDSPPGFVDPLDDSVFELNILEGFEGYSVKCGYADIPSKYKFSKQ